MKLTNYILNLGRAIAYYPGLKKVTGSTTSSILLCQFLYWSDKTKDNGWIWKTSDEIEEETGLTYYEQKTAKEKLDDLHLLEYEFKRLDHTSRYRINQEELNSRWEELTGEKSISSEDKIKRDNEKSRKEAEAILGVPLNIPKASKPEELLVKKGDVLDGMIDAATSPGMIKMNSMIVIKTKMEKKFNIKADNKKWADFIEFAHTMQEKNNESIDTFIQYALREGFNPVYWTPEKMRTLWPQAFIGQGNTQEEQDAFIRPLPKIEEKEVIAPMPRDIGRQTEL